jgi:hypothetical protein
MVSPKGVSAGSVTVKVTRASPTDGAVWRKLVLRGALEVAEVERAARKNRKQTAASKERVFFMVSFLR